MGPGGCGWRTAPTMEDFTFCNLQRVLPFGTNERRSFVNYRDEDCANIVF
jgi:hypothetical protein